MLSQRGDEFPSSPGDGVRTLRIVEGTGDAVVEMPHRRDELGVSWSEETVDSGDDAGAGVSNDEVWVVAEFVEDEQPGRRVRFRVGADESKSPGRVWSIPVGFSGRLAAAVKICTMAFGVREGSTHEGWQRLQSRQAQLDGRRRRLEFQPSGKTGEDGNPIPVRIHHPAQPKRTRPARFVQS